MKQQTKCYQLINYGKLIENKQTHLYIATSQMDTLGTTQIYKKGKNVNTKL